MRSLKQQQGMTAIGWILLLGLIIIISLPAMKIIPMYLNSLKITYTLKDLKSKLSERGETITPDEIKKLLLTLLDDKMLKEIIADEITVSQENQVCKVRIQHEYKKQIAGNWYIVLEINDIVNLSLPK